MSFGPWQHAFRNVTVATRRIHPTGITLRRVHRRANGPDAPHSIGRRFRPKPISGAAIIASCVLALGFAPLIAMAPTPRVAVLAVVVAFIASTPILGSKYRREQKCVWILPLWLTALFFIARALPIG